MSRFLALMMMLLLSAPVFAGHTSAHRSSASRSGSGHNSARPHKAHSRHASTRCATCARDAHGRIKRNPEARRDFMRRTGYPHGRKGYVVDHIIPLECGGSDTPSNMQWQTKAAARAKDKTEARCR